MAGTATRKPRKRPPVILAPMDPSCRLMALDVSSSVIGWSIFEGGRFHSAGLIRSPQSWISPRRIKANTSDLYDTMVEEGPIEHIVMEWQSAWRAAGNPNATGLATLGQSQGSVAQMIWSHFPDVPLDLVSEREWTKGKGFPVSKVKRAEKVVLACPPYARALAKNPKLDPGLDLADAVGIGIWRLAQLEVS